MKAPSVGLTCAFQLLLTLLTADSVVLARTIQFAGYEWEVRRAGFGNPGPNYWSDSVENIWVDVDGNLHLEITHDPVNDRWCCAEVFTREPTHYGRHLFYVISRLDSLDQNVIAALFAYQDSLHEIDIEFMRSGQTFESYNAQYVVQPWHRWGNLRRFLMVLTGTYTAHYFDWQADRVLFKSIHGHYEEPRYPWDLIQEWSYEGNDVPQVGDSLRVHINLYLDGGKPPSDGQEVEITIKDAYLAFTPVTTSGWSTSDSNARDER